VPAITLSSTGLQFSSGLTQTTKPVYLPPSSVGTSYGGGYYVGSLFTLGFARHLIVASSSVETTSTWGEMSTEIILRTGMDGYNNTENLVNDASQNNRTYGAASYCWNLTHNGFSDWYLPSIHELILLHAAASLLPNGQELTGSYYWSSNYGGPAGSTSTNAHAIRLSSNPDAATITGMPQQVFLTRNSSASVRPFRNVSI